MSFIVLVPCLKIVFVKHLMFFSPSHLFFFLILPVHSGADSYHVTAITMLYIKTMSFVLH